MNAPLVKNAADAKQVKHAGRKERDKRERELADLRAVLSTAEGRRVLWRMLSHCRVFESIWHPSALIHANAGRQDVGHFVMSEITIAGQQYLFQMMQEAHVALKNDSIEAEAMQTQSTNGDTE